MHSYGERHYCRSGRKDNAVSIAVHPDNPERAAKEQAHVREDLKHGGLFFMLTGAVITGICFGGKWAVENPMGALAIALFGSLFLIIFGAACDLSNTAQSNAMSRAARRQDREAFEKSMLKEVAQIRTQVQEGDCK